MAINKVIYGNETLIDITDTTATDSTVLEGTVFYNAAGVRTIGSALAGISDVQNEEGTSLVSGGVATIPEEIFIVNVTITSMTAGTADKTATEIKAATDAGKLPMVKATFNGAAMNAALTGIFPAEPEDEGNYFAVFTYENQDASYAYASMYIFDDKHVNIGWRPRYATDDDIQTYFAGRTINGYSLSGNINLTYSDVGAASASHSHTYSDVGAASVGDITSRLADYVPTYRKVNGKALNADVTLTASDVSALPANVQYVSNVNGASGQVTLTAADVGAASTGYVDAAIASVIPEPWSDYELLVAQSGKWVSFQQYQIAPLIVQNGLDEIGKDLIYFLLAAQTQGALVQIVNDQQDPVNFDLLLWKLLSARGIVCIDQNFNAYNLASGFIEDPTDYSTITVINFDRWETNKRYRVVVTKDAETSNAVGSLMVSSELAYKTEIPSTYSDVGAASASHTHTAADVGAVPTSRTVNGKALSSNITLTAADVGALPSTTAIPSDTNDLTNDAGYISSYTETDPTVPSWAKAASKPTYTYSEVGAMSADTAIPSPVRNIGSDNTSIGYLLGGSNGNGNLTLTQTSKAIVTSTESGNLYLQIGRSHSEDGKKGFIRLGNGDGQSEGYTDIVPTATGNKVLSLPAATGTLALTSQIPTVPTNVSSFTNDAGYISSYTETDPTVPSWAKAASKPTYTAAEVGALPSNTTYVSTVNGQSGAITIPDASAYILIYGSTVTFSEVLAAYNANRPIYVKYYDSEEEVYFYSPVEYIVNEDELSTPYYGIDCVSCLSLIHTNSYSISDYTIHWSSTTGWFISSDSVQVPTTYVQDVQDSSGNSLVSNGVATLPQIPTQTPQTTWYGYCSTLGTTAEKAVTCEGFTLVTGAIIGVYFEKGSNLATPTLNVNSTGAKDIYVGYAVTNSTTNVLNWANDTIIFFIYDGFRYRYMTSTQSAVTNASRGANTWYATCNSATTDTVKEVFVQNYVLTKGSLIVIYFAQGNTSTSAISLNINSTGAKKIKVNGWDTSSKNLLWSAGSRLTFMYDGTDYQLISIASDSIPQRYNSSTNPNGYLTLADLPIYDGSVS